SSYKVTKDLMRYASKEAIFLHCLPAVRGEEVDAEVIDGQQSAVWDQAENRLYTAMSVLSLLI
ncbi:MAG: ornithine carbamoyltransferase, partial [Sulfolobaceae archaeon]